MGTDISLGKKIGIILNFPYTYFVVELIVVGVYLRSIFFNIVNNLIFPRGVLIVTLSMILVYFLHLIFLQTGGKESETLKEDIFYSSLLPLFLIWKLVTFTKNSLINQNYYIKMSFYLLIFVLSVFTIVFSFVCFN